MVRTTNQRRGVRWLTLAVAIASTTALAAVAVPASAAEVPAATSSTTVAAASHVSTINHAATRVPTRAAALTAGRSATTGCPTVWWGSLVKKRPGWSSQSIYGVRTGQHPCYDRMVLDLSGPGSGRVGYQVRYVKTVRHQGSGKAVPVRGGAAIQIIAEASSYDAETGDPTLNPYNRRELANVTGYSTFRQIAFAGDFEGRTTIALGVRARLPMRAFVLSGPGGGQRLVIDVYHHW